MLDAETQRIADGDLLEGNLFIKGHKPTAAGIALGVLGTLTDHLHNLDRERGILFKVQVPEAADVQGRSFAILLLADSLWLPMGLWIFPLEESPMLRSWPTLVQADASRAVEPAIAFEPNKHMIPQIPTGS